jgi:demethylmenaquinone methyltransferase/2-methoxy-6-polyprenyl-1,4-benzoquinol methylase
MLERITMALSKNQIIDLYQKRANNYNWSANLYYLIGFREYKYRKLAVRQLQLKPGDTVLEIGCGTGLNLSLLIGAVGPTGRVIGVDLTDKMLAQAQARVAKNNWTNVELVHMDASKYPFPDKVNGIISTFAITLIPEYEEIIRRGAAALGSDGRMVIVDLRKPDRWPLWIVNLMVWITRPFGTSLDIAERKPWLAMEKIFENTSHAIRFGGFVFITTGRKK